MEGIFYIFLFIFICACVTLYISARAKNGGDDTLKDLKKFPDSKFEKFIRAKFEVIFNARFPSVYPEWLKYNGNVLELDGYNSELGIAFEAQGPQHSIYLKHIDSTREEFEERLKRDRAKVEICEKEGVLLIVCDYTIPRNIMGLYIVSRVWDAINTKKLSKLSIEKLKNKIGQWAFEEKPSLYVMS